MTKSVPKKVSFQTVGCRLNQYETERMAADLAPFGFQRISRGEPADLYVINTCTVTHRADKDSRYLARKARRENPDARVVLVGCYVETDPGGIAQLNEVDVVIRNNEKDRLADILPEKLPELFDHVPVERAGNQLTGFFERNRAWIKVSDGCNQTCSFCLVTIVRGELTARPAGEIIDEVKKLVAGGFNEIVLTAVNLGYYKDADAHPPVRSFTALCRRVLAETDLHRLRLSSIEPQTITEELLKLYVAAAGRICRHWHIPLQSGSSRILKLMKRPCSGEAYLEKVQAVKDALPGTIIGADIIAGFPGETEQDFAESCHLVESGPIDYLHAFSYSDRKGTSAAGMPGKIRPQVIKDRVGALKRISGEKVYRFYQNQIGQTLEAISEHRRAADGHTYGISDNYVRVRLPDSIASGKNIVKVKITVANRDFVEGEIIP